MRLPVLLDLGVVTGTHIGEGLLAVELLWSSLLDVETGVRVERGVREVDRDPAHRVDQARERDEVDFHVPRDRDAEALLHGLDQSLRSAADVRVVRGVDAVAAFRIGNRDDQIARDRRAIDFDERRLISPRTGMNAPRY